MRRVKWFVGRNGDSDNPFGLLDLRAATLYPGQDGSTGPVEADLDPQQRAAANRAFWEATDPGAGR